MYGIGLLCRVVSICSLRNYSSGSTKKLLEFLAAMPKANSARIAEAQRQRQQISKKSEKYGPSTVYLQVLGSGARGAPNTLYLFTDQKRYLFNCGECTQRLAHEHKVKLSKLDHIFITNKTWRNIGGLPGLSLTLQDVGVPNITLHGPEGLDELYQATRRFVIMKDMNVTMAKCSPNEDFEDNVMTVKYVLLGPLDNLLTDKDLKPVSKKPKLDSADKEFEEFIHDDTDYYRPEIRNMEAKMKPNIISKEKPKQKSSIMDPMKKKTEKFLHELQKMTNASVAYICTLKKRLGTLDLAKCVERGVKPGPLLGQLKSGQDVVLPDGTLVLSKDVKTPDDPGPVFIVLDMPDISYLKEDEFAAHFDNETNPAENIPTLCVHFTPPHVMEHPRYRQFMSKFGETTRHLVLNSQNSCLGSEAVHRSQQKLHLLDADVFPLLRDMSVPAVWSATPPQTNVDSPGKLKGLEELKNKIALAQFQNIISLEGAGSCKGDGLDGENESMPKLDIIAARTLTMFHLRPKKQLDRSVEPKLHIQDYIQETMDVDGFVTSLDQFRQLVDSLRYVRSQATREFPKLVFLGTGSCIPSKTRNTSAIALQVDENRSMLMDCGEGTFGQLVRFYGPKKVNAFLRTLKAIYISHLHADHHIGLIGVLQARRQAFEEISEEHEPLYLLAPGQIVTWLTLYDQQFERIKNEFTLIPNQSLLQGAPNQNELLSPAILAGLGLQQITTCLVAHCPNAFGVAIDIDPQNKVTYSGDTLPCEELVRIGENSKLLIHEATMEDELEDEARTKMHSTTSQAIDIGRKMNAKYTVLTHFSQRYARLPRLNAHILNDNKSVGIAFDNMQITMSDLELLPHMYAPLQLMFAEHCVEMELKAAQRARHKERRSSTPTLPPIAKCGDGPVEATPRWLTNACKTTTSVPNGHASYLETNASRLRQETKGMPINGIIRTAARSRSDSVSPNKTMKSTSKLEGGNETSTVKQYHTHAKSMEVPSITRRINDECNAPSYLQELPEHTPIIEAPYENVIDTRSKTLNKAPPSYRPPTCDEVLNAMEMKARIRSPVHLASASGMKPSVTDRTGYGKPLVTPMNKKLKIKRDPPSSSFNTRSDRVVSPGAIRSGSPLISPRVTRPASPAVRSSSPLSNKTHSKFAKPVESKSRGPEIKSPYAERIKQKERDSSRNLRDMNLDVKYSSTPTTNRSKTSPIRKHPPSEPIRKSQLPRPIQSNLMRDRSKHRIKSRPTSKQSLQQAKHQSNSNSKQSLGRNSPGNNSRSNSRQSLGKDLAFPPNHVCSITQNRSFRPQLEDIKSSFLILNAKKGHSKRPQINDIKVQPVSRPKLLNEDQRKQQLDEVKQKYQSKSFWIESKYEKIEGLNWISWK